MSEEIGYCTTCRGEGIIHTGIDEAPITECSRCDGTGELPVAATLPAAPAPTKRPITKEWCERMAKAEEAYGGNIEAGAGQFRATAEQEAEINAAVKAGRIVFEPGWDDPRPTPAPAEQPAHETIVREGNMLTCTACGTSKKMADPCAAPEPYPLAFDGELRGLISAHRSAVGRKLTKLTRRQLHEYIGAMVSRQRQEGRRDAHETNIALLGENCKLSEELAKLHAALAARQASTAAPIEPDFAEWCITKWHEVGGDIHAFARACRAARQAPTEQDPGEPYMFKLPGDHDWQIGFAPLPEGAFRLKLLVGAPDSRDAWPEEPTPEMQAAGAQAIRFDTTLINKMWTANAVYRAMRAAQEKAQ